MDHEEAEVAPRKRKRVQSSSSSLLVQEMTPSEAVRVFSTAQASDGIVAMSCDASGDGKGSGICAIVRQLGQVSRNDETDTTTRTRNDLWSCDTGRLDYDESVSAELEAITLGLCWIERHLVHGNNEDVTLSKVVILSDCCGARQAYATMESKFLCIDEAQAVAKRLVTSHGIRLYVTPVRSTHGKHDGFFDHAAADIIASLARGERYQEARRTHVETITLNYNDYDWLENGYTKIRTKGGSRLRKERLKNKLESMFGINIDELKTAADKEE